MLGDPENESRSKAFQFEDADIELGWSQEIDSYWAYIQTAQHGERGEEEDIILGLPEPQSYHSFDALLGDVNRELRKYRKAHGLPLPEQEFTLEAESYAYLKDGDVELVRARLDAEWEKLSF